MEKALLDIFSPLIWDLLSLFEKVDMLVYALVCVSYLHSEVVQAWAGVIKLMSFSVGV